MSKEEEIVLGKYNDKEGRSYVEVARNMGATYFNMERKNGVKLKEF